MHYPESRTRDQVSVREKRDTVSMHVTHHLRSQDRDGRSGVYQAGEELPSSLVSSFTKPRNQSPFTGLSLANCPQERQQESRKLTSKFDNTLNLPQYGQPVSLNTLLNVRFS